MKLYPLHHAIKFISIFSFLLLSGCEKQESQEEPLQAKTEVEIINPKIQTISEFQKFNAVTQFQKKESIRASSTGYIAKLYFRVGETVQLGNEIAALITKEQEAIKKLNSTDSVLKSFQKPVMINSNSSGILTSLSISEGSYVSEGDIIGVVSKPNSLVALVNVPFESHQLFKIGKNCVLLLSDGTKLSAVISKILPSVDPVSQSQSYIIDLSNHQLPENLNVIVLVNSKQHERSLCVETKAVQTNELQTDFWLMKIIGDSMAVKSMITIGIQNDSLTEILSGNILPSDKIISSGAFELPDSALVKIRN